MGSGSIKPPLFSSIVLLPLFLLCPVNVSGDSSSSGCSGYSFSQNRVYATCVTLPQLGCFLHWTYNASAGVADIAFRATGVTVSTSGNWVAWALNPTGSGMSGAQALVAYRNSSGEMSAFTSSVPSPAITTLTESALSFKVTDLTAEGMDSGEIHIYAKVQLPENKTVINQVWQVGPLSNGSPSAHSPRMANTNSKGTVNFLNGAVVGGGGGSEFNKKNIHGMLNAISWGTLMPIGGMVARYLKVFKSADPAWFNIHISCQFSSYVMGVAGWGLGLKLGAECKGITHVDHRNIGITLFFLGTLQVLAFIFRPHKDHKYRGYWNMYHHSVGFSVIILSVTNVFKGLDILDAEEKWRTAYTVVIVVLGCIALVLEVFTWIVVLKRKKDENTR